MATNQGYNRVSFLTPATSVDFFQFLYGLLRNRSPARLDGKGFRRESTHSKRSRRSWLPESRSTLPAIKEQRRIAAVLDAAEGIRAKRRQALAKLDSLTQAVFHDMFGDP